MKLIALFALGAGLLALFGCDAPSSGSASSHLSAGEEAWNMGQQFVTDSLKAPASAHFANIADPKSGFQMIEDGAWETWGSVDSQNSFGAMLRSEWRVVVKPAGGKQWRRIYLRLGDQEFGESPEPSRGTATRSEKQKEWDEIARQIDEKTQAKKALEDAAWTAAKLKNSQDSAEAFRAKTAELNREAELEFQKERMGILAAVRASPQIAQQKAIELYPALANPASAINNEFVLRVKQYKASNPKFFQDSAWPVILAEECSKSLTAKPDSVAQQ